MRDGRPPSGARVASSLRVHIGGVPSSSLKAQPGHGRAPPSWPPLPSVKTSLKGDDIRNPLSKLSHIREQLQFQRVNWGGTQFRPKYVELLQLRLAFACFAPKAKPVGKKAQRGASVERLPVARPQPHLSSFSLGP